MAKIQESKHRNSKDENRSQIEDNSLEFGDKFSRIFIPRYISVLKANAELLTSRETKFAIILQPNRLEYILKNDENTVDVKHLSAQLQAGLQLDDLAWAINESNIALRIFSTITLSSGSRRQFLRGF